MPSWGKLLPNNHQGISRKLGPREFVFYPPLGGVPSAVKFLTPLELSG